MKSIPSAEQKWQENFMAKPADGRVFILCVRVIVNTGAGDILPNR